MDLEAEGDEPDDIPVKSQAPKSNAVGQQNAQVDSIINNVLGKVPKSIAGDIRNAIARAPNKLAALKAELDRHNINMAEGSLGTVLPWPEVVNKVNSAMKAMGWKGQRKADGSFMFSTKGQLDDEFYIVIIDNEGNSMFTYALGTVEEGDPHIGEQDTLPTTEASVSELMNAIQDGFGLNENFTDGQNPQEQGVAEAAKSAAVRLGRAIQRVQGKTAASQARSVIPSSIPKPEPKKDEKIAEKLKTGPAAHFTPKDAHVKRGQFVGGDAGSVDEEKQRLDPSCWKGYKKQGTKMKGNTRVNNCVPKESTNDDDGVIGHMAKNLTGSGSPIAKIRHKRDTEREKRGSISYGYRQDPNLKTTHKQVPFSEDVENIMDTLINKIIINEAVSNNRK